MRTPRAAAASVAVLARAGLLQPVRPDRVLGLAAAYGLWGLSPAAGYAAAAVRDRHRVALVDAEGPLTFGDVDTLTTEVAAGLRAEGVRAGDAVGVLCGNGRGFVLSVVALSKAGATAVLLNTGSATSQLADVVGSERLVGIVHDRAYAPPPGVRTWSTDALPSVAGAAPFRPEERGHFVILTSGTTGRPKGSSRSTPGSLDPLVGLLSAIPLRHGEPTVVAAPLFHAWGFANWLIALALRSTVVLTGAFDAEGVLGAVEAHRATVLVAVPVMLHRLLDVATPYDTSSLRVVAVSGSRLPVDLAARFLDRYGDVLYDLYGSTEVGWAAIATPGDLRAAPGSVGRPPRGTTVVVDAPLGEVGPILVGGPLLADASEPARATGDLGRFDHNGRLYVVGREDDMVVSGGENVYPAAVEEVLGALPEVAEVAVAGVPDEEFGERLAASVVLRPGASLTADDVKAAVRGALARHYVPRDVTFVGSLPRNAAGKVVRRAL